MIELVRSWLVGITCAAMIVALAESLAPSGTVRKIGRLTGGLVLLLAILQPVVKLDSRQMAAILNDFRVEASDYHPEVEIENARLMKDIIEARTGAYIVDKAEALGIQCRAEVTAAAGAEEGDYPVPDAVVVTGKLDAAQRAALTRTIAADLAIPAERQTYVVGEDVE